MGAQLAGRVLIIDDVISAGTSVRESIGIIRAAGAEPAAVVIALDRQERGSGATSAAQEVNAEYGIPCISIAGLDDLIRHLATRPQDQADVQAIKDYRERYGSQA